MTPGLLAVLKQSKAKTATIAPEVGSDRMRRVINKGLTEKDILTAATTLVENGIPNLKLYFMIGLPSETEADVDAIIKLVKKIKHHFLISSRARKRIGQITVSLNSFVPKPFTPFQWVAMDEVGVLKTKIKKIKNEFKKVANLRINSDIPRWAYIQALFSRGDRRVADILSLAHANRGNWAQTLKQCPSIRISMSTGSAARMSAFPGILSTMASRSLFSGGNISAPCRVGRRRPAGWKPAALAGSVRKIKPLLEEMASLIRKKQAKPGPAAFWN